MYIRKTEDEFHLLVNYGQGWEHETTETSRKEILARKREYEENQPQYPVKWKRARVKISGDV